MFCCYHFTKTEKHWNRSANKRLELLNLLWPLKLVSHKYTSPDTISAHAVYTQVILKFLGMEPLKHVQTTNMTSSTIHAAHKLTATFQNNKGSDVIILRIIKKTYSFFIQHSIFSYQIYSTSFVFGSIHFQQSFETDTYFVLDTPLEVFE